MKKYAAIFELGWPTLNPRVNYSFPGNEREEEWQGNYLTENKKKLFDEIIPFVKKEVDFFMPYLSNRVRGKITDKGFYFSLGDNGKWFGLEQEILGGFATTHNMLSFNENAIAYNSASKLIEIITPEIIAPRIFHDKNKTLYYPLENKTLPTPENYKDLVEKIYKITSMEKPELIVNENYHKIINEHGEILIQNKELIATPKERHSGFSEVSSLLISKIFKN